MQQAKNQEQRTYQDHSANTLVDPKAEIKRKLESEARPRNQTNKQSLRHKNTQENSGGHRTFYISPKLWQSSG